jgi:hypothetical protein
MSASQFAFAEVGKGPAARADGTAAPGSATRGRLLTLLLLLAPAWIPALAGRGAVAAAAARFPLAESAHPYFAAGEAGLLYLWTPLVVASACLLLLSPGLFLALALDAAPTAGRWVLSALALSLIGVSAAAGLVQSLAGSPLRGGSFAALVAGCALAAFGAALLRSVRGRPARWPLSGPQAGTTLLSMAGVPLLLLMVLAPKVYWENFNGDGAHAFESARLLLVQPLPFWPAAAGEIAAFPGITSMLYAFPASWFIRLFGEVEVSARLPLLLYLAALHAVLVALVEHGRPRPLGAAERWLIWLALSVFVVVLAFSATYNPYSADLALPATQDTLLVVCFLGFVLGFLEREREWMLLFLVLTYLSLPSGAILIGFWLVSVAELWRPRPWRRVAICAAALLFCAGFSALAPWLLETLELPAPGGEYGVVQLFSHFAFLQWADWRRIAFLVVPSGILPAAALAAWRWQDPVARALTAVTLVYFTFFYVQAHVGLHYFVPIMLLPLVVFWRNGLVADPHHRPVVLAASGIAAVLALGLALPRNASPHTSARPVGAAIEDRIGGYETLEPAVFRGSSLLRHLFPYDWDPRVPLESYGGSPLVWNYYAHRKPARPGEGSYVLQPAGAPAPDGARLVAREEGAALYVRSDSVWAAHRALRPPTPAGSALFALPRSTLFRSVPPEDGPPVIDVIAFLERLGIDMDPLLARLGVSRS